MKKSTILIFLRYYVPGFKSGGPIKSIKNLTNSLSNKYNFKIVTLNRDFGDKRPYKGLKKNKFLNLGNCKVNYIDSSKNKEFQVYKILNNTKYDLIYLNSFFDKSFSIFPILINYFRLIPKKPIFLAVRGEFSKDTIQENKIKYFKKVIYIFVSKIFNLYNDIFWHATNLTEKNFIQSYFSNSKKKIFCVENFGDLNFEFKKKKFKKKIISIVFISRINKIKNLLFAIQVLNKVKIDVEFNIYGYVADKEYFKNCKKALKLLPQNIKVKFYGPLKSEHVNQTLQQNDILILPSLGENYGHIINEAFSVGTPVIISDKTPWTNLQKKKIGWSLSLKDETKFVDAINQYYKFSHKEKKLIRLRCIDFYKENILKRRKKIINDYNIILKKIIKI